ARESASAARAAGSRRSPSEPLRRLGLRTRSLWESLFLDRLRAQPQPAARARGSGRVRGGAARGCSAAAARAGADRCRQHDRHGGDSGVTPVQLGVRANTRQFALLVGLNALVGAMVGLERSVLPLVGQHDFGLRSTAAILAFVVVFGAAKAFSNLVSGELAERFGRKRLLVLGWAFALPVAPLIALAPSWWYIVAANVLLGINQ